MKEFFIKVIRRIKPSDFLLLLILPGTKYLSLNNPILLFFSVILFFICVIGYAFTTNTPRKPGQAAFNLLVLSVTIIICRFYFSTSHLVISLALNFLLLIFIKITNQLTPPEWFATKTAGVLSFILYIIIFNLVSY